MSFSLRFPVESPSIIQPFGVNWTGVPDFFTRHGLPGHEGVDFLAAEGTPVYAAASGTVARIGLDGDQDSAQSAAQFPYGNQVRLLHQTEDEEYVTVYAHLQRVADDLTVGAPVEAGQLIGYAGRTGSVATMNRPPHLHLTLKKRGASLAGETGFPKDVIDPTPFFDPDTPNEEEIGSGEGEGESQALPRLNPPLVPRAYNGNYLLQRDEAYFRRAWSWASNSPQGRYLNLIATRNAPYSNAERRAANRSTRHVIDAVQYLNPRMPPNGTPRYWVTGNNFFCNIFVNDATRLLHCEIPNNPANTSVASMMQWMTTQSAAHGWRLEDSGRDAQDWVNSGRVGVMIWFQAGRSGHAALIRPGTARVVQGRAWPRLAQAGRIVSGDVDGYEVFRATSWDNLKIFLHE